jgi:hypothetical protein
LLYSRSPIHSMNELSLPIKSFMTLSSILFTHRFQYFEVHDIFLSYNSTHRTERVSSWKSCRFVNSYVPPSVNGFSSTSVELSIKYSLKLKLYFRVHLFNKHMLLSSENLRCMNVISVIINFNVLNPSNPSGNHMPRLL